MQPGDIVLWAGDPASLPSDRALCDGSPMRSIDRASLYAVIGTTYGSGTGSGGFDFSLPNLDPPAVGTHYAIVLY